MTITVALNNVANLVDTTTSQSTINANSAAITQGFTSALNTTGDKMLGTLDMNSQQMINLPAPATANSPMRLADAATLNGGGTITTANVSGSGNILVSGSGVITTVTSPTFSSVTLTATGTSLTTLGGITVNGGNIALGVAGNLSAIGTGTFNSITATTATITTANITVGNITNVTTAALTVTTINLLSTMSAVGPIIITNGITASLFNGTGVNPFQINGVPLSIGSLSNIGPTSLVGNISGVSAVPASLSAGQAQGILEQGMTLLNVITATGTSVTDNVSFTGTYNTYMINVESVVPATATTSLFMQFNGVTTGYVNGAGTITSAIDLTQGSTTISNTAAGLNCIFYAHGTNSTTNKMVTGGRVLWFSAPSTLVAANMNSIYTVTTAITSATFLMSTGSLSSGTIRIYGLRSNL